MKTVRGASDAAGKRIGIVAAEWNELVVKQLLEGAIETLEGLGDPEVVVVKTPGAWEAPLAARALIGKENVHAVIVLGCILQGATPHAKLLASDASSALMRLQVELGVPIAWGVLTPETQEQALERAGMKLGNKGREAAHAAVAMIGVLSELNKSAEPT